MIEEKVASETDGRKKKKRLDAESCDSLLLSNQKACSVAG